jgi:hypothetical protein
MTHNVFGLFDEAELEAPLLAAELVMLSVVPLNYASQEYPSVQCISRFAIQ